MRALLVLAIFSSLAVALPVKVGDMMSGATSAPTVGGTYGPAYAGEKTFQATVSGTGAVSATVLIQVRNSSSHDWLTLATITLSGTTTSSDGFASEASWAYYRANLTAISGTGATVVVTSTQE